LYTIYNVRRSLVIYTPHPVLFGCQIEKNEMDGACSTYGERGGACRVLVGKPEEKRLLGRRRRKWEDNITMDL
jgi:hypothetical protein